MDEAASSNIFTSIYLERDTQLSSINVMFSDVLPCLFYCQYFSRWMLHCVVKWQQFGRFWQIHQSELSCLETGDFTNTNPQQEKLSNLTVHTGGNISHTGNRTFTLMNVLMFNVAVINKWSSELGCGSLVTLKTCFAVDLSGLAWIDFFETELKRTEFRSTSTSKGCQSQASLTELISSPLLYFKKFKPFSNLWNVIPSDLAI